MLYRTIATFFVMGGGGRYRECRRHEPCRGVWGYPPPEIFKFEGSEMLFSALVMRYVSKKIGLEYQNGKQLQFTIIKITESKENKSTQRLDVSGSTGPGGQLAGMDLG